MHSLVVRQSCTLQSGPLRLKYPPDPIHSYYNIVDRIPYAAVYISVTILWYIVYPKVLYIYTYIFFNFIELFLERGKGGRKRERNTNA